MCQTFVLHEKSRVTEKSTVAEGSSIGTLCTILPPVIVHDHREVEAQNIVDSNSDHDIVIVPSWY